MIYEGEYLNGKGNENGKEYYNNGVLRFESKFLDDKKLIGTEYDKNGEIKYQINNINGKGVEYYYSGRLKYEGEFLNGKKNGKEKEYYEIGELLFEGEYFNDNRWKGKGYAPSNNIKYELNDGKGLIKEYWNHNISSFEGEYSNGKRNGKGKEYTIL